MEDKKFKRRDFIKTTTIGLFSTGFAFPFFKADDAAQLQPRKIIYRTLGRTGLRIPIVSFGVMNSDSPDLINQALDMGINHLDTAHLYLRGNSERVIGEVLQKKGIRDKVYVGTKMRFARDNEKNKFLLKGTEREPAATGENLYKQLDKSLERLRTDYVDILYLHSCYSPQMATYEPLIEALTKVKKQGKARFIGVSTHKNEPMVIRAAVDSGVYDVVLTAYHYLQKNKDKVKRAILHAASKGVGVIAMKTQGGRRLQQESEVEINHQAALKWVLNDENVCTTIPGMTTFAQLEMNYNVMENLALSEGEKADLSLAAKLRGIFYCQNCRACLATCPHRVEIPHLMRAYMYANGYGNQIQARMTIAELPERKGLNICLSCPTCNASCKNGINIHSRIESLMKEDMHLG